MNKEQAIGECRRLKSYYPYRIVGIYYELKKLRWKCFATKTKAIPSNLARKGYEVYIY